MTNGEKSILYDFEGSIARVTLNRPDKRNALNDEMIEGLKAALSAADENETVKAITISGNGQDFCSGADLLALQKISEGSVQENADDARSLMELFLQMRLLRVPVVAAVRGRAIAGGCGFTVGPEGGPAALLPAVASTACSSSFARARRSWRRSVLEFRRERDRSRSRSVRSLSASQRENPLMAVE